MNRTLGLRISNSSNPYFNVLRGTFINANPLQGYWAAHKPWWIGQEGHYDSNAQRDGWSGWINPHGRDGWSDREGNGKGKGDKKVGDAFDAVPTTSRDIDLSLLNQSSTVTLCAYSEMSLCVLRAGVVKSIISLKTWASSVWLKPIILCL